MKSIRGYFPKDISSKERSIIDRLLQNSYNQIDVKSGYTLSGIYSYGGVLIFFIISILSVAVLSVMYAYASSYAFIPYLNIIFIIVFVALLCYSIIFAIKKSEIRNAGFIFISSVLIALFAIYLQWFVTLYIRFENWFQYKPNEIWTSINVLSLQSFWTIQGVKITGALSWSLCVIEAIIIFIPTIFAPTFLLMNSPYCEYCKRWFNGF